jgi:DNA-binding transcriptional regulator/RsmH inhibitor MraZ
LYLHSEAQHDDYVKGLSALFDDADERERDALRAILASFSRVSTDAQGRLTLGEEYVERAGLSKDLMLLANASRIEIWDPAVFEPRRSKALDDAWKRLDERRRESASSHRGRQPGDRGEGDGPAA